MGAPQQDVDGRHHFVRFTLSGNGAWFISNDARFFAYELTKAADEADAKTREAEVAEEVGDK